MRAFGRSFSKRWLLVLPAILLVCSPLLLFLFFVGNNLAGAIIGPPVIWNRPRHTPRREDILGHYEESERNWDRPKSGPDAMLDLKGDGSMTVRALPNEFGGTTCTVSGTGRWRGPDEDARLDLDVVSDGSPGSCKSDSYASIELAGQSRPYSLYWVLGDPDSGTGIWLKVK
jgi:hypothetical protein